MKKLLPLLILVFASTFFLNSCKKNSVEEQFTETVNPVIPDFTTQIVASVSGFVSDENGNAVEGAIVKGSNLTVSTDSFGYFKINSADFTKTAGFVQVSKPGYFTGYKTFLPVAGKESFVRLQLIPAITTGSVDAATGGTVSTADGAIISLPSNAVVTPSGNTYTGSISISAHWLDPNDMQETQLTMPGDLRGVDSAGHLKALTTFGMMAVELTSNTGELLQIATGKKASLAFPIPAALQAAAPTSIPLWYFDTGKGIWKQEGTAVKSGNNYEGAVSHFSFWNCDVPNSLVNFSTQLLDMQLNPLANIAVTISIAGVPNSERMDYTDTDGRVDGMIPANSNLIMNVSVPCNALIFIQNINTNNTDINLGSIKIDLQQYGATFRGTVNNCSGSPVTNGYVIIAGGFQNRLVNIVNGIFEASSTACPNSTASIIAFDMESSQQSSVQNSIVVPGMNDFGTFSACNASLVESITYTLDGIPTTLALPQHLFGGNFNFSNSSTNLNAYDLLNTATAFNIDFNGPDAPGNYSITGNIMLDQQYFLTGPTAINITAYGLIGQFITGSIPLCSIQDINGNTHNFTCTLAIKRDN